MCYSERNRWSPRASAMGEVDLNESMGVNGQCAITMYDSMAGMTYNADFPLGMDQNMDYIRYRKGALGRCSFEDMQYRYVL